LPDGQAPAVFHESRIPLKKSVDRPCRDATADKFDSIMNFTWEEIMMGRRVTAEPLFHNLLLEDHAPIDRVPRAVVIAAFRKA
jgi:hypothetical protein